MLIFLGLSLFISSNYIASCNFTLLHATFHANFHNTISFLLNVSTFPVTFQNFLSFLWNESTLLSFSNLNLNVSFWNILKHFCLFHKIKFTKKYLTTRMFPYIYSSKHTRFLKSITIYLKIKHNIKKIHVKTCTTHTEMEFFFMHSTKFYSFQDVFNQKLLTWKYSYSYIWIQTKFLKIIVRYIKTKHT